MTAAELAEELGRFQARGMLALLGTTLELEPPIRPGTPSGVRVRVTVSVPDTLGTGLVRISRCAVVADDLGRAVWAALLDVLAHEAGECLLRDAVPLYDPHTLPRTWPWL